MIVINCYELLSHHPSKEQKQCESVMVNDLSCPLATDHCSVQCVEELRAAAPHHRGGSVGGVLLQPTAVQPGR